MDKRGGNVVGGGEQNMKGGDMKDNDMNEDTESQESGDTPGYYAILPATIRYDKRLSPLEKLLYAEITCLTKKRGRCFATNAYFAELYDRIPHVISGHISRLAELGYIRVRLVVENLPKNDKKYRTRRYIWVVDDPENRKTPLTENHKPPLTENRKHNIFSKEKSGVENPTPLSSNLHEVEHGVGRFKRTTFPTPKGASPKREGKGEVTPPTFFPSPEQEFMNYWNELDGVIKHTNPSTKTHKDCIRFFKELEAGTFVSKRPRLASFLTVQHIPFQSNKIWTKEEILKGLDRLHRWCRMNRKRSNLKELLFNPHHPTGLLSLFLVVSSDDKWKAIRRGKEQAEDPDPSRTDKFCKLIGVNGDLSKRQEVIRHLQALREFRLSLPPEDKSVFAYGMDYHCPRVDPSKFLDHFGRWLEGQGSWLKTPSPGVLALKGGVVKKYLDEKWGKGMTGFKGRSVVAFLPV